MVEVLPPPNPWDTDYDDRGQPLTVAPSQSYAPPPSNIRTVRGPTAPLPTPRDPAAVSVDQARLPQIAAETGKAQADAASAAATQNRGGMTAEQIADLRAGFARLPAIASRIDEMERVFDRDWEGEGGGILGMGSERNIAGRLLPSWLNPNPNANALNNAANALIGDLAQSSGTTGGEINSLAELRARFGALLPDTSTDSDDEIRRKITQLRSGLLDQQRVWQARAHGIPDAQDIVQAPPVVNPDRVRPVTPIVAPHQNEDDGARAEFAHGDTKTIDNPALAGANAHLQSMIRRGATLQQALDYASRVGYDPYVLGTIRQAYAAIARYGPAARAQVIVSANADDMVVPTTWLERRAADIADSDIGAGFAASLDTLTGHHLDDVVNSLGGNGTLVDAGLAELRNRHPISSTVGDIASNLTLYGAARRVAARVLPGLAANGLAARVVQSAGNGVLADGLIGAYEGSGEDNENPWRGALRGGLVSAATGTTFRYGGRGLSTLRSPVAQRLEQSYAEGVSPSFGQRMGGPMNTLEQAYQSVPLAGSVQRSARQQARDTWERGAINRTLRYVEDEHGNPVQLPADTALGTNAQRHLQDTYNRAYDRVNGQLHLQYDLQLGRDLAGLRANVVSNLDESGQRQFQQLADNGFFRRLNAGTRDQLTGEELKATLSDIRTRIRNIRGGASTANERELANAYEGLEDAIYSAARRHSPADVVRQLDKLDTGYAHLVRIEDAARMAGQEPGRFGPRQLLGAERRAGGLRSRAFLRGDGLMDDYAQEGMRLVDTLPDSGTPIRQAAMGNASSLGPIALAGSHPVTALTLGAPWAANLVANTRLGRGAMDMLIARRSANIGNPLNRNPGLAARLLAPEATVWTAPDSF